MKVELIRWKKFKQNHNQLEGWFTGNEIKQSYDEVVSCGIVIKEDDNWLALASSLCNNQYCNPLQIFKPTIIKRGSVDILLQEEMTTTQCIKSIEQHFEKEKAQKNEELESKVKKLYNAGFTYLKIQDMLNIKYLELKEIVRQLLAKNEIKKRKFYLKQPIFYDTMEEYTEKRREIFQGVQQLNGQLAVKTTENLNTLNKEIEEISQEKWEHPKSIEKVIESNDTEEVNPLTKKVQEGTDWLAKYGMTEKELRELLEVFPKRIDIAKYLGIDRRIVSFMCLQIGERCRKYSRRKCGKGFNVVKT